MDQYENNMNEFEEIDDVNTDEAEDYESESGSDLAKGVGLGVLITAVGVFAVKKTRDLIRKRREKNEEETDDKPKTEKMSLKDRLKSIKKVEKNETEPAKAEDEVENKEDKE